MPAEPVFNVGFRVVEMTSQRVVDLNPTTQEWETVADETPVDAKFNQFLLQNGVVPVGAPHVVPALYYTPDGTRVTEILTVSAVVISADDHERLETARCQMIADLTAEKLTQTLFPLLQPVRPEMPPDLNLSPVQPDQPVTQRTSPPPATVPPARFPARPVPPPPAKRPPSK